MAALAGRRVLLGACTTLGPDFSARRCPGSQGWSGDALAHAGRRSAASRSARADDEWWRQFDDPVLEQLVAEAQRLNPGVRTAGLRILEARAQLGIAGSGALPATAAGQRRGPARRQPRTATAAVPRFWTGSAGLRRRPGSWTSGASSSAASSRRMPPISPASRSTTTCRCSSRRRPRASTRSIRTIELRLRIAHENAALQKRSLRDHRAPVSQRQRVRARRAAGPLAVPEHAGDDPRAREQPAPDAERAVRSCSPGRPVPLPELDGGREKIPEAALGRHRRPAGRPAAPPARRARGRDAAGRAVGADRRQRGGALSVDRARAARWSCRPPR